MACDGVKDLDVWSFFALPDGETRFPEDKRSLHVDFGACDLGRQRYDFSKSAIRKGGRSLDKVALGAPRPARRSHDPWASLRT